MANDRMYIVHVPTGLAVGIGKKYSAWSVSGDFDTPLYLQRLYRETDVLEYEGSRDEFEIVLESQGEWIVVDTNRGDGLMCLKKITKNSKMKNNAITGANHPKRTF